MKTLSPLCGIIFLTLFYMATSKPQFAAARCVNVWDEGCINDQLQGAGRDDDFVNGDFSPGKRCVSALGERCDDLRLGGTDDEKQSASYLPTRLHYDLLAKLFNNAQH